MHTPITGSVTSNPFNSLIRSTCLRSKISTLNSKPQLAEIHKRAKQKAAAQLQAAHPHRLHVCRNPFNSNMVLAARCKTDHKNLRYTENAIGAIESRSVRIYVCRNPLIFKACNVGLREFERLVDIYINIYPYMYVYLYIRTLPLFKP